jgi:TusA-related sulfurtransferase
MKEGINMATKKIDARGLACPQPVVLASRAIREGVDALEVIVDNEVSKENLLRLAKKYNMRADVKEENQDIVIQIAK